MPGVDRVEGTRSAILEILRRRSSVGVEELARELGLAGATVRRHLDVLLRDDYVAVTQERGRTGRPRHIFSLTEAGAELFPHHYVRLTHRLLEEIVALQHEETSGRDGRAIADQVFTRMSERIAAEYGPRVQGTTLADRTRSAIELIADEGIDFEIDGSAEGVRLLGRGCPCSRLAMSNGGDSARSCDHDQLLLSRVIEAEVVPLPAEEVPHAFLCGYEVREPARTADRGN
jgi:predicted ArsR family transcriptional regulator